MTRRDAFSGAANFIDLLAGLFLVFLVAFAYHSLASKRLQVAPRAPGDPGMSPAAIAAAQTDAALTRMRQFLTEGGAGRSALNENAGEPPGPAGCARDISPEIVALAPGFVRLEFGQSLFDRSDIEPALKAHDCLRRVGLIIAENLTSPGGAATTNSPVPDSPCIDVQIQAHADAKPVSPYRDVGFKDNLDLSALRAIEAERIMISDLAPEVRDAWNRQVSVAGYGERRPKAGTAPDADENRRVWVQLQWRWNDDACNRPPASFGPAEASADSALQATARLTRPRATAPVARNMTTRARAADPASSLVPSPPPQTSQDEDAPAPTASGAPSSVHQEIEGALAKCKCRDARVMLGLVPRSAIPSTLKQSVDRCRVPDVDEVCVDGRPVVP